MKTRKKLIALGVLLAISGAVHAAMVVRDPVSYSYMAAQVKDSALALSNQAKMLAEKAKELATQNQIFLTTKEIWTTARETQAITQDTYDAVVGVVGIPDEYQQATDREIWRAERNPITYADRIFKKYGHKPEDAGTDKYPIEPVEFQKEIKEAVKDEYGAGNGMYRVAARNQAKEEANLTAITTSQVMRQEISRGIQDKSLWKHFEYLESKADTDTTPLQRENTLTQIMLLRTKIALKQLELDAIRTEAQASIHYKAYKNTVSDEVIRNSSKEKRVDYNEILERDYNKY
jgi:hypothetical protein